MMPKPQAPSFDEVPCRTDGCQATPAAAIRCKQPQSTIMRQPSTATIAMNTSTRAQQHPFNLPSGKIAATYCDRSRLMNQKCRELRWISRDDASKKGTTLMAPPSLVQELDRIFTQGNLVVLELQHDALSGEMTLTPPPSCPPARSSEYLLPMLPTHRSALLDHSQGSPVGAPPRPLLRSPRRISTTPLSHHHYTSASREAIAATP